MIKINYKEVTVVTACPFCGHANEVAVNEADYWDWDDGVLAQDAFPYLSADEREMLISGICPKCWDDMFGDEEEDDPDLIEEIEMEYREDQFKEIRAWERDCERNIQEMVWEMEQEDC